MGRTPILIFECCPVSSAFFLIPIKRYNVYRLNDCYYGVFSLVVLLTTAMQTWVATVCQYALLTAMKSLPLLEPLQWPHSFGRITGAVPWCQLHNDYCKRISVKHLARVCAPLISTWRRIIWLVPLHMEKSTLRRSFREKQLPSIHSIFICGFCFAFYSFVVLFIIWWA